MPYQLLLPKTKVQPILSGLQTVITLDWAEPYLSIFVDKERMATNEQLLREGRQSECQSVLRGDIWELEITDEAHSYAVKLSFDDYGALRFDQNDIAYLSQEYHFHDLDDEWLLYHRLPYLDKPLFFYFHIDKVIQAQE